MNTRTIAIVGLYLSAIVLANITIALWGPSMAIVNAFLLISLDLTTRDILHDACKHRHLWLKMFCLIATGSLLSALLSWNAAPIALASFVAFLCAGIADAIVYALLGDRAYLVRVNGSNVVAAAVDSTIFPALAFGFPLLWPIMLSQFLAKILGGFIWSGILLRWRAATL